MKNFVLFFLLSFFIEGLFGESVSVTNGDSVTLHTGLTEIQEDDVLEWRFGDGSDRIAIVRKVKLSTYDNVLDGRFRGRLKPDGQTGDLTITNITTEHAGTYEISTKTLIGFRNFSVIVVSAGPVKTVSVMVGDSVTLHTGVAELQRYDVIQWRFGHHNSPIAEINRKTRKPFASNTDERFKDRLQLDCWTGSLTIRNIRTEHTGDYEFDISTSNHTIHKSFNVTVRDAVKSVSVKEGESVTLNSSLTEIQTDDFMEWVFGDKRFSISDDPKDRLKLDNQTGSLTISKTINTDSGLYELKISNSRRTIYRRITVTVTVSVSDTGLSPGAKAGIVIVAVLLVAGCVVAAVKKQLLNSKERLSELKSRIFKGRIVSVIEGEPITLNPDEEHEEESITLNTDEVNGEGYITPNPDNTEVNKDGKLQWMFRGSCIAERKSAADTITVYGVVLDEGFGDRLELDDNGSLTIPSTRNTDSGEYSLLITRPGKISIKRFRVSVFAQTIEIENKSVKEGESVTLKTDVTVDIKEDGQTQWLFGYTPLATITGGSKEFSPFGDVIFKDRLKLDRPTVSLTIKKIRPTDAGMYMLRKIGSGTNTIKLFKVEVDSTHNINKPKEESVTRNNPENVALV